jgi:hypothetical protein
MRTIGTTARSRAIHEADPEAWLLPWAMLPEIDDLLDPILASRRAGAKRLAS